MSSPKQQIPWTSVLLTALNAVVMLVILWQRHHGGVSEIERMLSLVIYENQDQLQWQQILGHMFVHGDMQHLFHNSVALICMGIALEPTTGSLRFLLIYLLCGIGSGLASVWWYCRIDQLFVVSVGASGAVFGMSGLLLGIVLLHRRALNGIPLERVIMMVAVSLASGFSSPQVNNCAHLAGAAGGFLMSPVIYYSLPAAKRKRE